MARVRSSPACSGLRVGTETGIPRGVRGRVGERATSSADRSLFTACRTSNLSGYLERSLEMLEDSCSLWVMLITVRRRAEYQPISPSSSLRLVKSNSPFTKAVWKDSEISPISDILGLISEDRGDF